MVFNYQWTDKATGNYAIRKRDTKDKKAIGEIEPKRDQTINTHFFLYIDNEDTDTRYNIYRINAILKTITCKYVYRGTNKKSLTHYITQKQIEKIFAKIEQLKDQTITIWTTPPKIDRNEKVKTDRKIAKNMIVFLEETYGAENTKKLIALINERKEKERELIQTAKRIKKEITSIDKEIYRKSIDTKNEKHITIEKIDLLIRSENFKFFLKQLYKICKSYDKVKNANERQRKYRERKNDESGKPKRLRGRPKKVEK
jgi:hypothetical protein